MMCREIALPARMASLFSAYKIGAVCQEAFVKTADRIGALPGLDDGEKIKFQPVKQTRGQDSHENMGLCCRRSDPPAQYQLFGATSQYGGPDICEGLPAQRGRDPIKTSRWCACAVAARQGCLLVSASHQQQRHCASATRMSAVPDTPRPEDSCYGFYRDRSGIAAFRLRCSRRPQRPHLSRYHARRLRSHRLRHIQCPHPGHRLRRLGDSATTPSAFPITNASSSRRVLRAPPRASPE
jgi:hypothetical protein